MATYLKLKSTTVGSGGASSVTFSSIPATYKHLIFKWSVRQANTGSGVTMFMRVNGNSSAIYASSRSMGYSSGTQGYNQSGDAEARLIVLPGATTTANTFGVGELTFFDYASSISIKKTMGLFGTSDTDTSLFYVGNVGHQIATTSAISSIEFYLSDTIAQYSSFYLYGVE